jgi:dTDP-4-dehydrorhamnose 3,5-epimerase
MSKFHELEIAGVFLVDNFKAMDERGSFVKTFHTNEFNEINLDITFKESFYTHSKQNVIRGLHFQTPPSDHEKLVYVSSGSILDIILDLRKNSATFGRVISVKLEAFGKSIFIPRGCAHGFCTPDSDAIVHYNVTSIHNQQHDAGIHWNSIPFDWPIVNPIVSARDQNFISFENFKSPFK